MGKKINLEKMISAGTIILSGRDKGEALREKLSLDSLEDSEEMIEIVIPEAIVSFNSSYFLGLFTPSIKKYKTKEGFFEKYNFTCDKYIMQDINDGIDEALKKTNSLWRDL